ncbi:MAG: tRNA preQ1(34) S-adenosylmethionine ribosyltransferase-isomerase QueA [Deltaproteobacteria bacterium]|nr:tRNA preQ1(34) S-adenosylmethionine ribosyltransferase-isomerase QueA [Deltaproteobacteria bacterium]
MKVTLETFDYSYPKHLIAQHPLPKRDASRLMVLDRARKQWKHDTMKNLPNFLRAGDLLIYNDTKVFPARLIGKGESGRIVEVLLLEKLSETKFRCLCKPARKIEVGTKITFAPDWAGIIVSKSEEQIGIEFPKENFSENLNRHGLPPLPPYIQRSPDEYSDEDRERYQSIFAEKEGSAAAPTASFHFSEELLQQIKTRAINMAPVTLHVSTDTFLPIREENILQHKMHGERFFVPEETQKKIAAAKKEGRRVIAIGTTAARALESNWSESETKLYITPGYTFKIIDGLLTNFHQPKSTLLLLVSAFAGIDFIKEAYREAIQQEYRLFSFGDGMLIL